MSTQDEDRVAHTNNTQNTLETSTSLSHEDIYALLETSQDLGARELIAAIKKLARGTKMAAKNVKALDMLCDRLFASVTATPTLERIAERLDVIDAKINSGPDLVKASYAAVASAVHDNPTPTVAAPKRPNRSDEVAIKIARNSEAEARLNGTGDELKLWVEKVFGKEVQGVQPHRSSYKVTARLTNPHDAQSVARCASKLSPALGAGARISVPHYGVVIHEVPLFYDPNSKTARQDLHAQNPSLIPSPESIVDMRWLVPKDRLPKGRRSGSWVVILDDQRAADNLIDQCVKVESLLLCARRYFSGPRQCRRCQQWGHLQQHCRAREAVCPSCAGAHSIQECTSPGPKRCVNCRAPHDAFSPLCPTRRTETLRVHAAQAGSSVYFAGNDFTFAPFPPQ